MPQRLYGKGQSEVDKTPPHGFTFAAIQRYHMPKIPSQHHCGKQVLTARPS